MVTMGSYEAKTRLAELLRRVESGERIRITRNGRPVADLVPADPHVRSPSQTVDALRAFSAGRRLGSDLSVRDLIEEGRR